MRKREAIQVKQLDPENWLPFQRRRLALTNGIRPQSKWTAYAELPG